MVLILMILAERLLKWMWSHEDDMLLPHALASFGQMQEKLNDKMRKDDELERMRR